MKLYTKNGDKGKSSLYDGTILSKADLSFDILGDSDELSSHIGMLASLTDDKIPYLRKIQDRLLDIGSVIANGWNKSSPAISEEDVKEIEGLIDSYEEKNSPLTVFILPGVNPSDAQAHICRSVSRRFERGLASDKGTDDKYILQYVNRLSDYFFALSRNLSGCSEIRRGNA